MVTAKAIIFAMFMLLRPAADTMVKRLFCRPGRWPRALLLVRRSSYAGIVEGIFDGRAVDSCFLCELLYPDAHAEDCPRCGRRMRYQPAVMMNDTALREAVRERALAYMEAEPRLRQQRLIELLEHLHRFAPASLVVLDELGQSGDGGDVIGLDRLRRDYRSVTGGAV
jgi:hypothetical protein